MEAVKQTKTMIKGLCLEATVSTIYTLQCGLTYKQDRMVYETVVYLAIASNHDIYLERVPLTEISEQAILQRHDEIVQAVEAGNLAPLMR